MPETVIRLINPLGLHARAAAKLVRCAAGFESRVVIHHAGKMADAKSILSVLTLAAACGSEIKMVAEGGDASKALEEITAVVASGFGEV